MTKRKIQLILTVLILAALPVGVFYLNHSLDRNIASDDSGSQGGRPEYDLSEATPEEFKKAFKYQMLKNATLERTSAGPGINLGLFLLRDNDGTTIQVCEKYKTIDLVFRAEGIAVSGEIPTLIVRGPCLVASDQRSLEILPIPFATILNSPLSQHEFAGEIPGHTEGLKVFTRNIVGFWPSDWAWVGVTLYAGPQDEILQINGYEIISVLGQPLIIQAP